jgi:hypothetical protein
MKFYVFSPNDFGSSHRNFDLAAKKAKAEANRNRKTYDIMEVQAGAQRGPIVASVKPSPKR